MRRHAIVVIVAGLLGPTPLTAQHVTAGVTWQRYDFQDPAHSGLVGVELRAAPFSVSAPLGRYLLFEAHGGMAQGRIEGPDGSTAELTGLTNTQVALSFLLADGALVLRADGDVPTPSATQSLGEARVAGVLSAGLLPFATPYWDGGGAAGGRVTGTFPVGPLTMVLSAGYRTRFEHELIEGEEFVYRPGDELDVSAVADVGVGKTSLLSFLVGYQKFWEDEALEQNLFRAGNRLQAMVAYTFSMGLTSSGSAYLAVRTRGAGEGLVSFDPLPGLANAPGHQLFIGGFDLRLQRGRITLLPESELRLMRSADGVCYRSTSPEVPYEILCPSGQGWLASGGLAAEIPVAGRRPNARAMLVPRARVGFGQVVDWQGREAFAVGRLRETEGQRSGITSWEAGLTLRIVVGS